MAKRMNAQIEGISKASQNASDGISIIETADGALSEIHDMVQRMNELATKVTTVYSDMPHSPNRNTGRMEETIAKIIDLEHEIDRDIDALVDLKQEIIHIVNSIESAEYRTILEMRYLQFKKWEQIALSMSTDLRWVYRMHGRALNEIQHIINSPLKTIESH